jgi:hypothetical protein
MYSFLQLICINSCTQAKFKAVQRCHIDLGVTYLGVCCFVPRLCTEY